MKNIIVKYRIILLLVGLLMPNLFNQQCWAKETDKDALLIKDGHVLMLKPSELIPVPNRQGLMTISPASGKIEVSVRDTSPGVGNFTIGVPNGAKLLYGHPDPGSGATTIQIDGVNSWNYALFGEGSYNIGTIVSGYPQNSGNQNITKWTLSNKITLTQTLSLVASTSGGSLDTVEMRYEIENNDTAPHSIGLRSILDTMLGSNDGAPFRVSGIGDITKEVEFTSANMPQYYDAFDNLINPTVQAKGTIIGGSATPPDRLVFAYWSDIIGTLWDYTIDSQKSLIDDSAVAMYWNPVSMNSGTKKTYVTYYGLGNMSIVSQGSLTVGISSVDQLTRDDSNKLSPNPFQLTAYIKNTGNASITGAIALLTLPNGLQLEPNQYLTQSIGTLTPSQQVQLTWLVNATDTVQGNLTAQLEVSAVGINSAAASKTITIPNLITITNVEYFIDTDPGEGNGMPLTAVDGIFNSPTESVQVSNLSFPLLKVGQHTLYIRCKDSLGRWSEPSSKIFNYDCSNIIAAAEYFIDSDPGEGKGIALSAADGAFDSANETVLEIGLNLTSLAQGQHTLFIRYKTAAGVWSGTAEKVFNYACSGKRGGYDSNGDGKSDIFWRNKMNGKVSIWLINGTAISSYDITGEVSDLNWEIINVGDFNGDGKTDFLWKHKLSGKVAIWLIDGTSIKSSNITGEVSDLNWEIINVGDFNGDGKSDLLWRNKSNGRIAVWIMNGTTIQSYDIVAAVEDLNWEIINVGDFNGDGKSDLLWRNKGNGKIAVWLMNGTAIQSYDIVAAVEDLNWEIINVGDFNSDGKTDFLWRHKLNGKIAVWLMNGTAIQSYDIVAAVEDLNWEIINVGDFNSDGKIDLLWKHKVNGKIAVWLMNGTAIQSYDITAAVEDLDWEIISIGDFNADGKADLLWRHKLNGKIAVWLMNGTSILSYDITGTVEDLNWKIGDASNEKIIY